jgi:hypothetical protein
MCGVDNEQRMHQYPCAVATYGDHPREITFACQQAITQTAAVAYCTARGTIPTCAPQ